jgi:hypothetical protein
MGNGSWLQLYVHLFLSARDVYYHFILSLTFACPFHSPHAILPPSPTPATSTHLRAFFFQLSSGHYYSISRRILPSCSSMLRYYYLHHCRRILERAQPSYPNIHSYYPILPSKCMERGMVWRNGVLACHWQSPTRLHAHVLHFHYNARWKSSRRSIWLPVR